LIYDTDQRATCRQLIEHSYFTVDGFIDRFENELRKAIDLEKEKDQNDKNKRKKPRYKNSVRIVSQSNSSLVKDR
jgi:C4-type Zn-finger protein